MFVILAYDLGPRRVQKALKICRRYLVWVQRSVFEGEITEAKLRALKDELEALVRDDDAVVIYRFDTMRYSAREFVGKRRELDLMTA